MGAMGRFGGLANIADGNPYEAAITAENGAAAAVLQYDDIPAGAASQLEVPRGSPISAVRAATDGLMKLAAAQHQIGRDNPVIGSSTPSQTSAAPATQMLSSVPIKSFTPTV